MKGRTILLPDYSPNTKMTDPDTCPICLIEYTVSDLHRPASLKCGHLFGYECLTRWFGNSRSAQCPTCAKMNKKSDIRTIYATSVRTTDCEKEKEILQKYLDLKDEYDTVKEKNNHLELCIKYLQDEVGKFEEKLKNTCVNDKNGKNRIESSETEYKKYKFVRKMKGKNKNSFVVYDISNPAVYVSSRDNKTVGYKKIDYECKGFEYYPLFDHEEDFNYISDMKISSFNDGLLLIAFNKTIKLINTINGNELMSIVTENRCRCLCFDNKDRNIIYFADEKSIISVYDFRLLEIVKTIKMENNLHSIAKIDNFLYVGCIFNWFRIDISDIEYKSEKLEMDHNLNCTNLISEKEKLLVTFRDKKMKTIHLLCHKSESNIKKEIFEKTCDDGLAEMPKNENMLNESIIDSSVLFSRCTQFKKRRDKIAENAIYVCNENKNIIEVYSLDNFRSLAEYRFQERIVDFVVHKKRMYVLTENYIVFLEK